MSLISIVSVGPETLKPDKNGKAFGTVEVFYTVDGKARQKKVMTFAKEIYATIKNAKQGDTFELVQKKNGEYWDWVSLTPASAESGTGASPQATSNGSGSASTGYSRESNEERAKRQVMIVRQSSISNAVALLAADTQASASVDDVIDIAKQFERYVLNFEVEQEEVE